MKLKSVHNSSKWQFDSSNHQFGKITTSKKRSIGKLFFQRVVSLLCILYTTALITNSVMAADNVAVDKTRVADDNVVAELDPAMLIPLDVSLLLNNKYVGQVSIKVDPASNQGLIDSAGLLGLLRPLVNASFYASMVQAVADKKLIGFQELSGDSIDIKFDQLSLEVQVSLSGGEFDNKEINLRSFSSTPNPSLFVEPAKFTSGLNISTLQRYTYSNSVNEFNDVSFDLDGFINFGGFNGVTLDWGGFYDLGLQDGEWKRREVTLSKDFFDSALRVSLGELTPTLDGFQGTDRLLGVGIFHAYSKIRPFQIIRPTGRQEFVLDEASTVEVFVNEELIETLDLQSGSYSLTDFPLGNRANGVRLDITSNSGYQESLQFDVYAGNELLEPGLIEFGFFTGLREGSTPLKYSQDLGTSGFMRYGFNDQLTLGLNLQFTDDTQQLGALAIWGNNLGLFQLEMASSRQKWNDITGRAFALNFRRYLSLLNEDDLLISSSAEYRSTHFQHAFEEASFIPSKWRTALQASWSGRAGFGMSLGLGANISRGELSPEQYLADLSIFKDFGDIRISSSIRHTTSIPGESENRYSLTINYRPNKTYSSSARYDSMQSRKEINLRRTTPNSVGNYDGNIRYTNSERSENLRIGAGYIHNRFELDYRQNHLFASDDNDSAGISELRLNTFLGFSGGKLGIGRPSLSGFVVSPVHKSLKDAKVEIYNGNELVARSGWFGGPLIPLSRAYSVNRYDIVVDPLPIGYDLGEGVISTFHAEGNSYNIPIGSDASRTALGYMIGTDGPLALISGMIVPEGSTRDKEKHQRPFFTNRGGRFVADRLRPGTYEVIVNEKVIAKFSIPEAADGIVDLGEIRVVE